MHSKLTLAVLAATIAASAPAFAAISDATMGNGELLVNFRSYVGDSSKGGDDMSAVFDLGVSMNDVIAWNGQAGFTRTWNLVTGVVSGTGITGSQAVGSYGTTWNDLLSFVADDKEGQIEFNVIALDNTDKSTAGGSRYLTTAEKQNYPGLTNKRLDEFELMNAYVKVNNMRGTHGTSANGASAATPTDTTDSYFGKIAVTDDDGGISYRRGDNWLSRTTDTTEDIDSTQSIESGSNFWFLTTSSTAGGDQATKRAFGFDINGNGQIDDSEFSGWSVNRLAGTITFATPVPEMHSWAMLLAGLGIVSMVVRRRTGY